MIKLSVAEFKWSTSEQIYPYEKSRNGRILYCKEVDFGALPNNGNKSVAHNIASLDVTKVFHYSFYWYLSGTAIIEGCYSPPGTSYIVHKILPANCYVADGENLSAYSGLFRIIYAK
jgi:hypothetical protein